MDVFWSSNTQTDENLETYSLIWPNAFVNTSQENIIKIRRGNMGLFLREP